MDQHLAFLVDQAAHIEPEVYRTKYPDIQYHELVPIDTSANEYASNVTHFSMDMVGRAEFINQRTSEVPVVETHGARHIVRVESVGAGYDYTLEEIGQAMMLGIALTSDKAMASRRAAEEFMDDIVLRGATDQGWDGLLNSSLPTHSDAAAGAGSSRFWNEKTGAEIIRDVNQALSGLWAESRTIELGDTVLIPPRPYEYIANTPRSDDSDMSIYEWIKKHNLYTARDGERADDPRGPGPGGDLRDEQQRPAHRLPEGPDRLEAPHAHAAPLLPGAGPGVPVRGPGDAADRRAGDPEAEGHPLPRRDLGRQRQPVTGSSPVPA